MSHLLKLSATAKSPSNISIGFILDASISTHRGSLVVVVCRIVVVGAAGVVEAVVVTSASSPPPPPQAAVNITTTVIAAANLAFTLPIVEDASHFQRVAGGRRVFFRRVFLSEHKKDAPSPCGSFSKRFNQKDFQQQNQYSHIKPQSLQDQSQEKAKHAADSYLVCDTTPYLRCRWPEALRLYRRQQPCRQNL